MSENGLRAMYFLHANAASRLRQMMKPYLHSCAVSRRLVTSQ